METGDPSLYTKAEDLLDEAKKLQPQSPELFAARGFLALARHDFAAALGYGTRALALDPQNARYHGIVGDTQIELGMYDEAIESYQEMVNSRPDFASFSRVAYARVLIPRTCSPVRSTYERRPSRSPLATGRSGTKRRAGRRSSSGRASAT